MMNRKQLNRQQTIHDIESAFLALYLDGGIDNVNISKLCQNCCIARSTFYLYFEDKYAVLQGVEDRLLGELWDICGNLPDEIEQGTTDKNALRTIEHLRTHLDWYRALLSKQGDPAFVYRWKKDIERSLCIKFNESDGKARDSTIRGILFASALIGLFTYMVMESPNIPDHVLCSYMDDLLKHLLMK